MLHIVTVTSASSLQRLPPRQKSGDWARGSCPPHDLGRPANLRRVGGAIRQAVYRRLHDAVLREGVPPVSPKPVESAQDCRDAPLTRRLDRELA